MRPFAWWRRFSVKPSSKMLFALATMATSATAYACPPGTVFSAYNGRGICAYIGQGAKAQSTCTIANGVCPPGTDRNHSGSDPNRDYCCQQGIRQGTGNEAECRVAYGSCSSDEHAYRLPRDPTKIYCCPDHPAVITPTCNAKCAPLLQNTKPQSEANRVHQNCMVLCTQPVNGKIICPDLTTVALGQNCK
jgi:hypothetical protein